MRLKEAFKKDAVRVFFNFEELAVLHELNGVLLASVESRCTERLTDRQSEDYEAVHGSQIELTFRAEDFMRKATRLPKEKDRVRLDGVWYDVVRSQNEFGVCRLRLTGQEGPYR